MRRRETKMLADERRRAILQLVKKQGSAAVEDLVKHFNVSAVTLRADLGQLAREGALVRSYGGAMVHEQNAGDYPLTVKNTRNQAEKTRIAAAAVRFIKSHQTVILDSGSTSAALARAIRHANFDALTVITHALNIAQEFLSSSKISVIMLGGIMRHVSGSFVGPQTEQLLRALHADHFFLGMDGLDQDLNLSTPDLLEAQLNTMMMQISNEVTVIADASKMGRRSLSVIGSLTGTRRLITDTRIDQEMAARIREAGVELVIV
jgi:DeoR family transcriptional regulator, aga operon transcriptional repressor